MSSDEKRPSRSGAITTSNGERHIPSSTRADGSVRKEIRIRPGYRPPEDIDVYRSKTAQAWRDRGKGAIPGAVPGADSTESKPTAQSASANKNAKRREARKKAAATAGAGEGADGDKNERNPTEAAASATAIAAPAEQQKDPEAEREKEAKKLAKKLRQARELKDKKDKGDSLLPEQFEKVIRINELVRQLDNLGFDSNGDKKQQETEKT
ncbi:putative rna binding protein pym [Diplodia seriata]|uniref:Putative rna binding protein pym n=1 Tax=Diplodia seriata TaxID=420778 RepID=A0A0G2HJ54_9PEZI|nr:putative rna binding protein pym [Diplodia seriata]